MATSDEQDIEEKLSKININKNDVLTCVQECMKFFISTYVVQSIFISDSDNVDISKISHVQQQYKKYPIMDDLLEVNHVINFSILSEKLKIGNEIRQKSYESIKKIQHNISKCKNKIICDDDHSIPYNIFKIKELSNSMCTFVHNYIRQLAIYHEFILNLRYKVMDIDDYSQLRYSISNILKYVDDETVLYNLYILELYGEKSMSSQLSKSVPENIEEYLSFMKYLLNILPMVNYYLNICYIVYITD